MKRTNLFIIFAALCSCWSKAAAENRNVDLSIDYTGTIGKGHPCAHPTVTYDDDEITIKSDSTINDLTVVVRDQYGQVLNASTITVSQDGTIIYVPSNGDSEKTTIDLYYKREHAKGYF